jgi:MoaA/NifB/PqqE/SkfB family radical SAM enzyme
MRFNKVYYVGLEKPRWPSSAWDNMVAKGGLNLAAAGTDRKVHIDLAILSITSKCMYECDHCYERMNIDMEEIIPVDRWMDVITDMQEIGVGVIVLSGGEPMMRYDGLLDLVRFIDNDLSDIHIYTSGNGVTRDRVKTLKEAGLVAAAVGLDDIDPVRQNFLRGYEGAFSEAMNAIACFTSEGIFTYINTCLTKELVRAGDLWQLAEAAKEMNAGTIRLLEPKPCGGYLRQDIDQLFTEEDRRISTDFFLEMNTNSRYREYPVISYPAYFESSDQIGCTMGGLSQLYIDSKGNVEPCTFLPVSFGNIADEEFSQIFRRMRNAIPYPLHKLCPSIHLSESIREFSRSGRTLPVAHADIEQEWQSMFKP